MAMKIFSLMLGKSLLVISMLMVSVSAMAETITLKNEKEILHAVAMNEAIDRLTEKVMSCIKENDGKTEGCICVDECSCKFKDNYISAKRTYQSTVNTYPHWGSHIVFYQRENDPQGYNINFAGLQHQFSASCEK
jgi:hypothetical protein